jgi:hypothetical protein
VHITLVVDDEGLLYDDPPRLQRPFQRQFHRLGVLDYPLPQELAS